MAIVQTKVGGGAGGGRLLKAHAPTLDPAGFDDVSAVILFRGTATDLATAYPLGGTLPGFNKMYCCGPQGAAETYFGHMEVTISWKGFIDENKRPDAASFAISTRETMLPITYQKSGGGVWTSYAGPPWAPAIINPKTGTWYRVRLIDRVGSVRLQGVQVGAPNAPIALPEYRGTAPPRDNNSKWESLLDPTVNYPYGWVLRDYQVNSQYVLGNTVLNFWTAFFEYVERFSP